MTLGRAGRRDAAGAACATGSDASPRPATTCTCEKTFECADGRHPEWILGLNVEGGEDEAGPVNGVVIELTEAELDRLDIREIRYDRVEVTGLVDGDGLPDRVVTYTAKEVHFTPEPPGGRGHPRHLRPRRRGGLRRARARRPRQLPGHDRPLPGGAVEATLVRDAIPEGNPRAW